MFFRPNLIKYNAQRVLNVREKSFSHILTENRYRRLRYNDDSKESCKHDAKQNETKQM